MYKRQILATTRNPDFVLPLCRSLEISDPIVCSNGAQVWGSPSGPVWAYYTIATDAALAIARLADAHDWELSTTVGSMTYWRRRPGQALGPITPSKTIVPTNSGAVIGGPVRILVHQSEAIPKVQAFCQSELADKCYTEQYYKQGGAIHSLGVFPIDANKGMALAQVLDKLAIQPANTLAIGDNPNDLPMFDLAHLQVAMGNAPKAVKRRATVVGPSNDKEGVAWALKRFVLGSP